MERAGVVVFAISYDPVDVLAAFSARYGITYNLLSDQGSRVIRELGLLNEHLAEHHAYYGGAVREHQLGVPYPGAFVLDEAGMIVEKRFEQSYRVRPTGVSFVEDSFGAESTLGKSMARAETEEVRVAVWLDAPTYRPYQKLRLGVEAQVAPGLHVYGQPVPEGMVPLTVEIEPLDGLEPGQLELPKPHPFEVEGLDETFYVYEGTVRGVLSFILTKNLGDVPLSVRVHYQTCSDTICYAPGELALQLPLAGLDMIRD